METSKANSVKERSGEYYVGEINRIATDHFNAGKSALSSKISRHSKLVVRFTEVETNALKVLVDHLRQGPGIAVFQRYEKLKQLQKEIILMERKSHIKALCQNIYGALPTHFGIHLPSLSEDECRQCGLSYDSSLRFNIVTLERITKELEFYDRRDKGKPTTRDMMSVVCICLFILLKGCIFKQVAKRNKVHNDEFLAGILSVFIDKNVSSGSNIHEMFSENSFTKKLRRHMGDPKKKKNVHNHMKLVGLESNFLNYV